MDIKNNPLAYWSFQTQSPKEDVRDTLSSVFMKNLRMQSPFQYTPWKLNLFRIEEFEKYFGLSEQYKALNHLRGWDGASDGIPFLSPPDMIESYFVAQRMIKGDSNLEEFVKKSKEKELNYIIQANHDGFLPSASCNGSIAVLDLLTRMNLELFKTVIGKESKDFRNQLNGYYENSEEGKFKIIDVYCKEIE